MSFASLLNRTCTVEAYQGDGRYGPVYGVGQVVPCRVEAGHELVRDASGDEVVSSARVFLQPSVTCPAESRVTLPDGTVTTAIAVATFDGATAAHHLQVAVK